jgi:uncharacterized protein
MSLHLTLLRGDYAVCRLESGQPVPDWAWTGEFVSVTRTADELSIVCDVNAVPDGVRLEAGWACLKLQGPFAFELTGILSSVLEPLRDAGVGIFAVSTFDTDYVLLKRAQLGVGNAALEAAGHSVSGFSVSEFSHFE